MNLKYNDKNVDIIIRLLFGIHYPTKLCINVIYIIKYIYI